MAIRQNYRLAKESQANLRLDYGRERFRLRHKENLFAEIQDLLNSTLNLIYEGNSPSAGKFYSLFQVFLFNLFFLHFFSDKNISSMFLIFKIALQRAVIFAVLPAVVIYFGADFLAAQSSLSPDSYTFAAQALSIYALSVVLAAINSIFITLYLSTEHKIISNVAEFMRSIVAIIIFLKFAAHEDVFWSFLFAEVVAAVMRFLSEWLTLLKKFSDTGKNDFLAVHIFREDDSLRLTLRGTGNLFDYSANPETISLIKSCNAIEKYKFSSTLGMNNLYLRISDTSVLAMR